MCVCGIFSHSKQSWGRRRGTEKPYGGRKGKEREKEGFVLKRMVVGPGFGRFYFLFFGTSEINLVGFITGRLDDGFDGEYE